ncbi:MAG: hypothetical protein IT456_28165 [Planctomycetes bacterium]|nr:hypothetical protein [Planctomycetota bacterium]
MKFFFPDAHDHVDPEFDFETEATSADRQLQHSDHYAHELLGRAPYDGLLLSKSIVDGVTGKSAKFTTAQRHRLRRLGAHQFFRVSQLRNPEGGPFPIMADCGAFSYIQEEAPPITIDDAIEFYQTCGFTHGQSIDHIIADFRPYWDEHGLFGDGVPEGVRYRYDLTLRLAEEFITACRDRIVSFVPVGVAQGWSPRSYVAAVQRLYQLGYRYIALGGLVPLKTTQLLEVVRAVMTSVKPDVKIHLLGVIRWEHLDELVRLGVASFDSTSPLRQAFLDSKSNYYTGTEGGPAYAAIRVPQSDGNLQLMRRISSGQLVSEKVRELERRCLDLLRAYGRDKSDAGLQELLDALDAYVRLIDPKKSWRAKHERTLRDRPWERCGCSVCKDVGIEVVMFRGANRNRRRGFHNLFVSYERVTSAVQQSLSKSEVS